MSAGSEGAGEPSTLSTRPSSATVTRSSLSAAAIAVDGLAPADLAHAAVAVTRGVLQRVEVGGVEPERGEVLAHVAQADLGRGALRRGR